MRLPWWQTGIIYQIYPRSFADSNGDGIGDINGIRARLDYLVDLGVDALWLSPIYPSPDKDFGYDVADFCDIDPKFGTLADFDCLLEETHARGMRIILDLVLNHTSDQHPWFRESRSCRDNPKRGWYIWADPAPGGGPPNNWQSAFGGSGWEWDSSTGQYFFHMFLKEQPDVNWQNPEVRQAMLDVFRFWLDRGVDGFRLDVFNAYFKCADLSSNPVRFPIPFYGFLTQEHIYDCSRPEMIPLLQEIRVLLDAYSSAGCERYVIGETFHNGARHAAAYIGPDRLHAAFNFDFMHSPWWAGAYTRDIQQWEQLLGDNWPNYVLNNHDQVRSATRFQSLHFREFNLPLPSLRPEDDSRLKVAAAMLLTLRGTPFLYYGEEIGMRNIPIRRKDILDPVGRRFWPIFPGRDGCRSPMQWDASTNAGFSPAGVQSWLPVHENYLHRNIASQSADLRSLLNFYRSLIAVRRATPALTEGMYQPITFGTRFLMAYLRQTKEQTVLVALNLTGRKQRLVLGSHLARAEKRLLLSTHRESLPRIRNYNLLPLDPYEAIIIEIL